MTQKEIDDALELLRQLTNLASNSAATAHYDWIQESSETIRAALQRPVVEWQDISTAPKDGGDILLIVNNAYKPNPFMGRWKDNNWQTFMPSEKFVNGGWTKIFPTHWTPLPDAPKGE